MSGAKKVVLELVNRRPEDCMLEDVQHQLCVWQKVERSMKL
jgi:hypothetical protein